MPINHALFSKIYNELKEINLKLDEEIDLYCTTNINKYTYTDNLSNLIAQLEELYKQNQEFFEINPTLKRKYNFLKEKLSRYSTYYNKLAKTSLDI